jgi:enoyl-CoA hydratase
MSQNYDDLEKVKVTREGAVLAISLNRPESRNAINGEISEDLHEALRRAAEDTDARAILLKGEGKSFCVGGDVKDFDSRPKGNEGGGSPALTAVNTLKGAGVVDLLLSIPQPTVAAVQGHAMGLGATLALFCDVVVAAEDAQFADTHVNIGLVAGDGGAAMWPLIAPFGAAKWYLMTGDRLTGSEAERLGMVLKAVPAEDLPAESLAVATRLSEIAPMAVQGTKATLNKILRHRMDLTLDFGLLYEGATFVSEDHREAASAFVEKRQADFKGR